MLKKMRIRNFTVFENAKLTFSNHLNVITGIYLTQLLRTQLRAIDPHLMVLNTDLHRNEFPWTVQDS